MPDYVRTALHSQLIVNPEELARSSQEIYSSISANGLYPRDPKYSGLGKIEAFFVSLFVFVYFGPT